MHDRRGNIVSDGEFFYQYDAWSRLVQVNQLGTLTFDSAGKPNGGSPGPWVAHFTYDGLGRLIRRQSPWDDTYTALKTESYYYDGVRRIQEVWRQPIPGDGPISWIPGTPPPPPVYAERTEREYIWSPGYVDELICQLDNNNDPLFAIQDASYCVVGLVRPRPSDGYGEVLAQSTWDPYGEILAADVLYPHADCRVGHQGLFHDRLDGFAAASLPTLAAGTTGFVHNRNRSYRPDLGRFMQADPNGTALSLMAAAAMHGEGAAFHSLALFDHQHLFGDGMSLYAYVGSNPTNRHDALGLIFMVDEGDLDHIANIRGWISAFIAEYAANLEADAYWAADWDQDDDWYSQSGEYDYYSDILAGLHEAVVEFAESKGFVRAHAIGRRGTTPVLPGVRRPQPPHLPAGTAAGNAAVNSRKGYAVNRKFLDTPNGKRALDGVSNKTYKDGALAGALEIKSVGRAGKGGVGTAKGSAQIDLQIKKDVYLIQSGQVRQVEWSFVSRSSSVTSIKASPKLLKSLQQAAAATGGRLKFTGLTVP